MKRAVIVQATRTPIGKQNGMLQMLEPHELLSPLLAHLSNVARGEIDDVIVGNVVGPGGNVARLSVLEAGLPFSIPGITLDRQCSAGLEAIRMACLLIQGGAGKSYLAGGVESTSTSTYQARARFSPERIGDPDMGVAAELVAEKLGITKKLQDKYTLLSYERSLRALAKGYYEEEILPIGELGTDEELLKQRNIEKLLMRAKPVFVRNGTVTAANSCGIHDGASAALIMEEGKAIELGFKQGLRFIDSQVCGVDPHYPALAPVPAIKKLLERNQLSIADIDLFEINEAFAVKMVACTQELSIPIHKLNVRGGALTIGHPYGASGAIMITRLFYEVKRRKKLNYVVAAIGSGGGVGLAVLMQVFNEES